jgi:adenylate cyclase
LPRSAGGANIAAGEAEMHEIERKFLVRPTWVPETLGAKIVQGYLNSSKERAVRVRLSGDRAWLTVKGPTEGISRLEFEYAIPAFDAIAMLDLCERPLVEKTRHEVKAGDHVFEIDVFFGENAGLIVAEIELDDEDEWFLRPDWLGPDVSHDLRLFNSSLSLRPFGGWRQEERDALAILATGA